MTSKNLPLNQPKTIVGNRNRNRGTIVHLTQKQERIDLLPSYKTDLRLPDSATNFDGSHAFNGLIVNEN